MSRLRLALAGCAAAAAIAVAAGPAGAAVPGKQWDRVGTRAAGLDAERLKAIAADARAAHSDCLLVAHDGRLAAEWDFRGSGPSTAQDVFSVTKSITSTLVGIAADDGDLRLDDPAARWIPAWRGTPAEAVTVADLLSNDSGREWSPVLDYRELILAPDRTAFAIGLAQTSAPGEVWAYNNAAIQTLQQVLQRATGEDVVAFAERRLLRPLGMRDTTMGRDNTGHALMFAGVRSTCRDLARFGTLMLNGGRWGDRRIVSRSWVRRATGRPSTELNAAYGLLWWLNRKGRIAADPLVATSLSSAEARHGRLVPDAPGDLFWALGLGNQVVQVDPGSRTVVVRLGDPNAARQGPAFGPSQAARVVTEAVRG